MFSCVVTFWKLSWAVVVFSATSVFFDLALGKEMYFPDRITVKLIVKNSLSTVTQFSICTADSRWQSFCFHEKHILSGHCILAEYIIINAEQKRKLIPPSPHRHSPLLLRALFCAPHFWLLPVENKTVWTYRTSKICFSADGIKAPSSITASVVCTLLFLPH